MRRFTVLLCTSLITLLSACGEGLQNSNDRDNDNNKGESIIRTGHFEKIVVSGISYETPSYKGVTDENGTFQYKEGETITFSLGDTVLGSVTAKSYLILPDLVKDLRLPTREKDLAQGPLNDDKFQVMTNILVLLQTLDYDSDPSNGITITPDVAAVFVGKDPVNFHKYWRDFLTEIRFRAALKQINDAGMLFDHRKVVHPVLALNNLYSALRLTLYVPKMEEKDDSTDSGIERRTINSYDSNGFLVTSAESSDVYYGSSSSARYIYDADGLLSSMSFDINGDDAFEYQTYYTYDSKDGYLKEITYYEGVPAKIIWRTVYSYDDYGLPRTVETYTGEEQIVSSRTNYDYDKYGNQTLYAIDYDGDKDNNKNADHSYTDEYDDNGNHTLSAADETGDGVIDSRRIYEYENGKPKQITHDDNGDNDHMTDWHFKEVYNYDAKGLLSTSDHFTAGNPIVDSRYTYEYDQDGNKTLEAHDKDGDMDENTDADTRYTWEYENGKLKQTTYHNAESPQWDIREEYFYKNGYLSVKEYYLHDNNIVDASETYEFDKDGNQTRLVRKNYAYINGPVDTKWEFDAKGNNTKMWEDSDGDGVYEFESTKTHQLGKWGYYFTN